VSSSSSSTEPKRSYKEKTEDYMVSIGAVKVWSVIKKSPSQPINFALGNPYIVCTSPELAHAWLEHAFEDTRQVHTVHGPRWAIAVAGGNYHFINATKIRVTSKQPEKTDASQSKHDRDVSRQSPSRKVSREDSLPGFNNSGLQDNQGNRHEPAGNDDDPPWAESD